MKKISKLLLGTTVAVIAGTAMAGTTIEEVPVSIRYEPGMSVPELYERIKFKAAKACKVKGVETYWSHGHERTCRREVVTNAVKQFAIDELSAMHAKTGSQESYTQRQPNP